MATPNGDNVTFINVLKSYPPGETLEVSYNLHDDLKTASRDWVGLFRVGWSSSRDYYTFEWVQAPTEKKERKVVFAGRRLPPEDKHFYQFCYVSSDGRVRGASSPFQFTSVTASSQVEDLELVEVSEDSIMILQPRETVGEVVTPGKPELEEELVTVKESVTKLEAEREALVAKYAVIEQDMSGQVKQMQEKIDDLERQLQAKRESETRLMEKLEKERALTQELTQVKSDVDSQTTLLHQQLSEQQAAFSRLQAEHQQLNEEAESLRRARAESQRREEELQIEHQRLNEEAESLRRARAESQRREEELQARIEQDGVEMDQLRELQVDLMTQIGEKTAEMDCAGSRLDEMGAQFAEEASKLRVEKDALAQELAVAQQNIAELVGAKEEGVVVAMPVNQEPPTLPSTTQINMVDKSAYEALQSAYEDIEDRYHESMEGAKDLRSRLHEMKQRLDVSQIKNAELTRRVECCREEYQAKCKEMLQLQKAGGTVAVSGEVVALKQRLQEMEENQEQVTKSWENAIRELASRKEELKLKDAEKAGLEETLRIVQEEYTKFQDTHDRVVNDKTARLDEKEASLEAKREEIGQLRATINSLSKEKGRLEHTVQQLREQLEALKKQAKSTDRSCPVCNTKFPARITQQDFERHVQGHFAV